MPNSKLTPKQDRFCREYVVDCNATQAAIRAGYSKKTANEQGARLLANVSIQHHIAELQKPITERLDLDAGYVLERLKRNEEKAFEDGKIRDSNKALELLGKHLRIFTDRVDLGCQEISPVAFAPVVVLAKSAHESMQQEEPQDHPLGTDNGQPISQSA